MALRDLHYPFFNLLQRSRVTHLSQVSILISWVYQVPKKALSKLNSLMNLLVLIILLIICMR